MLSSCIASAITFRGRWSITALSSAFLSFSVLPGDLLNGSGWIACLLPPPLLFLFDIIDGHEGNGRTIWRLHIDLGRQRALVRDLEILSVLLSKDDIAEVDRRVLDLDQGLLAGADEWDVDLARFTQDGEDGVDVLVELGSERDGDGRGETGGHAARRRVLNVEEVLDLVLQRQKLERTERK